MNGIVLTPENHSPSVVEQLSKLPKKLASEMIRAHIETVLKEPAYKSVFVKDLSSAMRNGISTLFCNRDHLIRTLRIHLKNDDSIGLAFFGKYPEYAEPSEADVNDLAIAEGLLDPPSEPSGAEMEVTDELKHKVEDVVVEQVVDGKEDRVLKEIRLKDDLNLTRFEKLTERLSQEFADVKVTVSSSRLTIGQNLQKMHADQTEGFAKLNRFIEVHCKTDALDRATALERHESLHDRLNNLSASWQLVGGLLALDILVRVISYFI
jgi:hypothetical protein